MHVLLLHSRPLEFGKTTGGVPEFLRAIAGEFIRLGMTVTIYAGHKSFKKISVVSAPLALSPASDVTINIYSGPIIEPSFIFSRRKIKPLVDLCQKEKIDILHAQGTYTPGFMVRELSRITGLPYVVTSHSDIHPVNSKRLRRRNVRTRIQRILRDAAWVTHLTPVMETASHELHDTKNKSSRIHNGIHSNNWLHYRELAEKNYMLGIGRLERGKGFHILIGMYAELVKRGISTSLMIAGTGQEEEALQQQCHELKLNVIRGYQYGDEVPTHSVIFAGYVRDQLKYQIIAESRCVLFATQPDLWEEAFGIVQLEAMAAAKPLVASDTAATRYLETLGLQAKIVQPQNITAWANEVELLLNESDTCKKMGTANAAAIQSFDWCGIAKAYQAVYVSVLTGLPKGLKA